MNRNSLYERLNQAVTPYLNSWEEWIACDYCFLTENEVTTVNYFLNVRTIQSVAKKINRSKRSTRIKLNTILIKFLGGVKIFKEWDVKRMVDESFPLNTLISCLKITAKIKRHLHYFGETLNEILNRYNESDLLKRKGFGPGMVLELRCFLHRYGYAYLLRVTSIKDFNTDGHSHSSIRSSGAFSIASQIQWSKVRSTGVMPPLYRRAGEERFRKKYLHLFLPSYNLK